MINRFSGSETRSDSGLNAEDSVKAKREIDQNIFAYINPMMLFMTAVLIIGALLYREVVVKFVLTHVEINMAIIATAMFAYIKCFVANYKLFKFAKFVHHFDGVIHKDEITETDVRELREDLAKRGYFINMSNTEKIIDNMLIYGHPAVSDHDARLIKSKLGFRLRFERSNTGFIAGLLVMMGLLGTYVGLLVTVESIGQAVASLAAATGAGTSDFVGRLAGPLTGMGIAFSASLLGAATSLIVGVIGHIAAKPQDKFIERFGLWLDDLIPAPGAKAQKAAGNARVPGSDDLKAWLAGFAMLSHQTTQKMTLLIKALAQTTNYSAQMTSSAEAMSKNTAEMKQSLDRIGTDISSISGQSQKASIQVEGLARHTEAIKGSLEKMGIDVGVLSSTAQGVPQRLDGLSRQTEQIRVAVDAVAPAVGQAGGSLQHIGSGMAAIQDRLQRGAEDTGARLAHIAARLDQLAVPAQRPDVPAGSQAAAVPGIEALSDELRALIEEIRTGNRQVTQGLQDVGARLETPRENQDAVAGMMAELSALLDEMNNKNSDQYMKIFNLDSDPEKKPEE